MTGFIRKNILISMIKKEFRQYLRDKRMRLVLFGSPIIMLIVFGYAVNTDIKEIKMAVLDEDKTSESRKVIEKFRASGYFTVSAYLKSENELQPLMDNSNIEFFLRLENGFSKKIKKNRIPSIQLIGDGSDSNRSAIILSYSNEILSSYIADATNVKVKKLIYARSSDNQTEEPDSPLYKFNHPVLLKERIYYNPTLLSRNFFLPGMIGLIISIITIIITSMSIVRERETGTIDQIIVSPIKPAEYILGKTIPTAIIGFIDICVVTSVAILWFNVPFNGNIFFLLLGGILYILSTLAVGLYISTISKTQQQAMLSTFLFLMPAMLLSDFIFPIYAMPQPVQIITYFNPMRYFMHIVRGVFLKGAGISILWPEFLMLFLIGSVLIYLSAKRFSRRLE